MSGTPCPECAHLEREREEARKGRDHSRVTDCNVLIKRHPNHSEKPAATGRGAGAELDQ